MSLFNFCYNVSIILTSLSLAAILLCTAPIFVLLISAAFLKEKITGKKLVSLILAFSGCVFVSGIFDSAVKFSLPGVAVGLLAGFGYGMYTIVSRYAMNRGYEPLTINGTVLFSVLWGALFLRISALLPIFLWNGPS